METSNPRTYRDLDAWVVAMDTAVTCYGVAKRLPPDERFALSAQIRRAAVSVPSNIAEGHATRKDGLFRRHLRIALGSVGELETSLELAVRLKMLGRADVKLSMEQLARVGQLLHGLIRTIGKS